MIASYAIVRSGGEFGSSASLAVNLPLFWIPAGGLVQYGVATLGLSRACRLH